MPREDVPYPTSAICSIRERIAELQDELGQLLKTVNGVAGDANHEIKLISDNAALGITNDAAQHEIHLDLDASQLPAALVDSVNGQIGTVVLDGDDLDGVTPGNSVNDDIAALQGADVTLQGNINAEATARANADSALQTNINAALATIPGEVASQIANDVTISQLVAADAQNVKLTGAQNVGGVKTFSSIPLVPTAANGSTDQSAANTNWISQTGAGRPNNLIHASGDETIDGQKKVEKVLLTTLDHNLNSGTTGWYKVFETDIGNVNMFTRIIATQGDAWLADIAWRTQSNMKSYFTSTRGDVGGGFRITRKAGIYTLWAQLNRYYAQHTIGLSTGGSLVYPTIPADYTTAYAEPTAQDYDAVITPVYQA